MQDHSAQPEGQSLPTASFARNYLGRVSPERPSHLLLDEITPAQAGEARRGKKTGKAPEKTLLTPTPMLLKRKPDSLMAYPLDLLFGERTAVLVAVP